MYVLIKEIQQGAGAWMTHDAEGELSSSDLRVVSPVSVSLKLTNADTRILVQGVIRAEVRTECARCNEEFTLPLEVEIEEDFVPENSPEAKVTGIDEFEVLTYKEDRIVLDEMLRQNFLAAVPMQPICQGGDCEGMCDQCGTNLNTGSCECEKEEIDPRWAKLGDLTKRSSNSSLN